MKMLRKQSRIVFILIFYVPEEFLFIEEEKQSSLYWMFLGFLVHYESMVEIQKTGKNVRRINLFRVVKDITWISGKESLNKPKEHIYTGGLQRQSEHVQPAVRVRMFFEPIELGSIRRLLS